MMNPKDTSTPQPHQHHRDLQIPSRQQVRPANPEERAATANILRDRIDAIYETAPPNQLQEEATPQLEGSTYDRTYSEGQEQFNAQQYHNAWQQYYQQYYQRYYLQQLHVQRQQLAAEKAKTAASQAIATEQPAQPVIGGTDPAAVRKSQVTELKETLIGQVKDRAKKVRKSHHFMPIMSALLVGLVFLFLQYNRLFFAQVKAYISPGSVVNENDTVLVDPASNVNVGAEPKLIIPKINVNIHVVYDITSLEDAPVQEGLKKGVVHYKLPGANSLPGQVGNTVILGHSSNDIFDPGDYKFAFVLIDRLQAGDVIYMHYGGKRYIYRVTEKKVITPTEFNALQVNNGKPMLTLVTCTPPGTALKRLLVFAEQISPDPSAATQAPQQQAQDKPLELPANSPTLFDRVRDFFF